MELTRLGRTNLMVTRTAFGVLPIQRIGVDEAVRILRRAYDAGINLYDTARGYTDSEEKIGRAFEGVRSSVFIATKTGSTTRAKLLSDLDTSLRNLRTDYVDILQLHNPGTVPDPDDPESAYAGLVEAQRQGKTRFIGYTNHSLDRSVKAVESGLYDVLQYPLCSLSSAQDLALVEKCRTADVGFLAMKPMSGGLLANARSAFAFLRQYESVVPLWGIQKMDELDEFLALEADPPALDDAVMADIERDRGELASGFCRACGYCLPCPAGIPIPMAARMGLLLNRMPYQQFLSDDWRESMNRINDCQDCGHCRDNCPYELDAPELLRKMLADYEVFYREHGKR